MRFAIFCPIRPTLVILRVSKGVKGPFRLTEVHPQTIAKTLVPCLVIIIFVGTQSVVIGKMNNAFLELKVSSNYEVW